MYDSIKKLIKNDIYNNNTSCKNRLINFDISGIGNFEKSCCFETRKNVVNLTLNIETINTINIQIFINDLLIFNEEINASITRNIVLNCDKENVIKFVVINSGDTYVNIFANMCGILKNNKKHIKRVLSLNTNFYTISADNMTISNDIMSNKHVSESNNYIVCDKIYDHNYTFNNSENLKNDVVVVYKDGEVYIKNMQSGLSRILSMAAGDCCIIPVNNLSYSFVVLHEHSGFIFALKLSENYTTVSDEKLSNFSNKNIVKVKSIVSENYINYFLFQDTNLMWYIAEINHVQNKVEGVRPYVICDDLQVYESDGNYTVIQSQDCGIRVDKYSNINFENSMFCEEFLNATNAVYCDGKLYIETINTIMEKEIN